MHHWTPWGMCCIRSGDILVHMMSFPLREYMHKIVLFQGESLKQEIDNDEHENPIFKSRFGLLYITENNKGDICVSDTSANIVMVMDWARCVRFRYDGRPARRMTLFCSRGIVIDAFSQIIVADINNDCLHILDQNGQFLRCVDDCGLEKPHGLSVDSEMRLWVGCKSGKISVIQYLKVD